MPVVVQPHEAHRLEHHQSGKDGTDKRDEAIEHWDTGADQVSDNGNATSAAQPRSPMDRSVRGQVPGSTHESHEETLCWQL